VTKRGRAVADRAAHATGVCLCRKTEYVTVKVAVGLAKAAEKRGDGRHRVYACPTKSRTWHLTHKARPGDAEEIEA